MADHLCILLDGGHGELTREASITGVFEVALGQTHTLVVQLEIP